MSYILDALNKAEKDRQQQASTDVPTVATQNALVAQNKGKFGLYFIIAALIIVMLWVLFSKEEMPSQHVSASQEVQVIDPISKVKPVVQIKQVKPLPIQQIEKKIIPVEEEVKAVPNIMGLDENIRNMLPNIQISAHVFGEDASKRMVIINNRVMHEGDYLAEQLQLTAITDKGIALNFKSEPFTMKIKDKWPPY